MLYLVEFKDVRMLPFPQNEKQDDSLDSHRLGLAPITFSPSHLATSRH